MLFHEPTSPTEFTTLCTPWGHNPACIAQRTVGYLTHQLQGWQLRCQLRNESRRRSSNSVPGTAARYAHRPPENTMFIQSLFPHSLYSSTHHNGAAVHAPYDRYDSQSCHDTHVSGTENQAPYS